MEKHKKNVQKIHNLYPYTFDSLVYRLATDKYNSIDIKDLTPFTLTNLYPWFQNKPFRMKKAMIREFEQFCRSTQHSHITSMYPKKQMLNKMIDEVEKKLN